MEYRLQTVLLHLLFVEQINELQYSNLFLSRRVQLLHNFHEALDVLCLPHSSLFCADADPINAPYLLHFNSFQLPPRFS